MSKTNIFDNVQKHISLDESEKNIFESLLVTKEVRPKDLILRQGQLCKKIYFVESGSLRAFNLGEDGKESTIMFAIQDWWITDMDCFVNQKPASLSIEVLEESKVIELRYTALEKIYKSIPKFERFFRILFQNAYVREQLRSFQHISLTTEQRYTQFLEKYPAIAEKVTQKQIASYLGVTPEFLSSVKNNLRS